MLLYDLKGDSGGRRRLCDHQGDSRRGRGAKPQPHDGSEEAADHRPPRHQEVPRETSGHSWKPKIWDNLKALNLIFFTALELPSIMVCTAIEYDDNLMSVVLHLFEEPD